MSQHVLDPQELQTLRNLQSKRDKLTIDFGFVEIKIQEFELQKEMLINSLVALQEEEKQIGSELQTKYGRGMVDLEKGEFTASN